MALIDTGASCTCISGKVIKDLGLTPIGKQRVGGVHGSKATNAYQFLAGIVFPQSVSAAGIMNATVMTFPITGVEFVPPGAFDVLLGRDVLCQGHFSMSFSGQAVLCL